MSLVVTIALATSASAFDITLGPETPLSPPSISAAPYEQHLAGVASNGREFLALWLDRRSTVPSSPYVYGGVPLYVSRVDRTGRPANPFGLKLKNAADGAALVWTWAGYMVLWSENGELDSMLLNDDGVPISAPKRLADGYLVGAASNGRTIFVIHGPFSQPQFASVYSTDGALLSRTNLDPGNHYPQSVRLMVMPNGDYGFVAQTWSCPGLVPCVVTATLSTFSESGASARKPLGLLSQWSQSAAAIGEGRLMLAWINDNLESTPARNLSFRIFDTAGNPLSAETTVAETNDVGSTSGTVAPSVGWDGQEFMVAWQWPSPDEQSGDVRAVRVTIQGSVMDPSPIILSSTFGTAPWFASTGSSTIVAWDTFRNQSFDISARGAVSFDLLNHAATNTVPQSAALQTEVQLATLGTNTLAVWREGDTDPSIVGSSLGGPPVLVSPPDGYDQQTPAVAASRDEYLVVWREQAFLPPFEQRLRILGKRFSPAGVALDGDPIVIAEDLTPWSFSTTSITLAVGSNGTDFYVVWPAWNDRLRGTRVSSAGAILDESPVDLSQPPNGTPGSPRIGWNGSEYLVAWTADPACKLCGRPPDPPSSRLFVARVGPGGNVVDSRQLWSGGYGTRIALARRVNGFLVVWGAGDPVSDQGCIYAMSLADDGDSDGPVRTIACVSGATFPDLDIAWDGASFVLAWTQAAGAATMARAVRVSSYGTPLDDASFNLSPNPESSFQPALAPSHNGVVAAYGQIATGPQYGNVSRIFARTLQRIDLPPRRHAVTR
jgi:hypothetical protein